MNRYTEAPNTVPLIGFHYTPLFLAGGISGTEDWQATIVAPLLNRPDLWIINPRRNQFDIDDFSVSRQQIEWEHVYLRSSSEFLFWFPPETLCPIALLELGRVMTWSGKPLYVGCHPDYSRKFDLKIQLRLERPEVVLVHSLEELVAQVVERQPDSNPT